MSSVSLPLGSTQAIVDNLFKDLECPVALELYEDPVQLGCVHSLSRISAEKIFGKMKGSTVERPGRCPVCFAEVISYKSNLALRNIVEALGQNAEVLSLAQKRLADEPLPVIPYPGKSSAFIIGQRWRIIQDDQEISRIRKFSLIGSAFALIKHVAIYGHLNDSISVVMDCRASKEREESIRTFYHKLPSNIGTFDASKTTFLVKTARGLDWVFAFLTENNTFHSTCDLPLITRLLQEKKWRHIEEELNLLAPRPPRIPVSLPPALPLTLPPSLSQAPATVSSLARSMEGKLHLTSPRSAAFEQKNPPAYELKAAKTERRAYTPTSHMQVEG